MANAVEFAPPPNPGDTLSDVLVIKLGALGDFFQAMGAMRVVREAHPSAKITLLTTPPFAAVAQASPYVDAVEANGRPKRAKDQAALVKRLKAAGFGMVYDFQNNGRTERYFKAWGPGRPLWSGAAAGASHRHTNPNRAWMHNFDRLDEQLRHAGLTPKPSGDPGGWVEGQTPLPDLGWLRATKPSVAIGFGIAGQYALLIPGSSPEEPEKRWPADRFAAVAEWLAGQGITPVIVGGKAEAGVAGEIAALEPRVRNLAGQTDLLQLAGLARGAALTIGGDTGPTHLAAAADAPGVCLFAQRWTPEMQATYGSVLNPRTRLGHAIPTNRRPMITIQSVRLELVPVERVISAAQLVLDMAKAPEPGRIAMGQRAGLLHRSSATFVSVDLRPDERSGLQRLQAKLGRQFRRGPGV